MKDDENNGERRLLWKALNMLSMILIAITLTMTSWTLCQVTALQISVASLLATQQSIARRLERIENQVDDNRPRKPEGSQ